ncbi:MAG: aldehyde ferredoxin oxidoreductase [Firmicutes bacterium]|nr:aldehyde ferredoxin oxidoreductase [Bacillota bacterium]
MAKFIRVNMTDLTVDVSTVPSEYSKMGGRGLTSHFIFNEVNPECHPLGPNNKLIFAPGIVTGTAAPSSGRISVGAKSPLTGGIKESNSGTPFSQSLARLGYKAIVIEGQPENKKDLYLLKVTEDDAELIGANELEGKGAYETVTSLNEQYQDSDVCCIGPAGEKKMTMAGICFNDPEYRASRYSGRGGLGAVMGSKGLKAIVVEKGGCLIAPLDEDVFRAGQRKLVEGLRNHGVTQPGGTLNAFGTAALINVLNQAGGLPTRNFREGVFEGAEKISGEHMAEVIKERGGAGMTGHACHPGCVIQCSNVYPRPDGSDHVSCIEYESAWSLGANLGVDNLDQVAEMIRICNDVGIDTIEAGVALGVAMEAGLAEFGDGEAAIKLLKEIGKGSPLGHILGNGAGFTGRAFGVVRIPVVKNQAMPAYEPRAVKGIGITYITTPMGADHTAGYTIAPEILGVGGQLDPLDPKGKMEISRAFQAVTAFVDSCGYCLFITFATTDIPSATEGMVETVNGVLGTEYTPDDIVEEGLEILRLEKTFNERAGFTHKDDRPPEFMRYEKLPPHNHVYDVPDEELDEVWNF